MEDSLEKQLPELLTVLNIWDNQGQEVMKELTTLKTYKELVSYMQKLKEQCKIVFPDYIEDAKNNVEATKYEEVGSDMFRNKSYDRALWYYNKCLMNAEINTREFAIAYANRSALLFEMGFYKECLMDIQRSLRSGYTVSTNEPDILLVRKKEAIRLCESQKHNPFYEPPPEIEESQRNKFIVNATDAVRIGRDSEMGRMVVASRDIKIGEVLAVEKPFVINLTDKEDLMHCSGCLELCLNMIPCPYCTCMLYCSSKCRNLTWKKYHRYECKIVKTLEDNCMNDLLLPLRLTLLAKDQYHKLDRLILKDAAVYRSDRYLEIYNLMGHEDKQEHEDRFLLSKGAVLVSNLIEEHSDFFENVSLPNFREMFALLFLQHILICRINCHQISEIHHKYKGMEIGVGVYPFLSLFNHSCRPNVFRASHGNTIVMRAIRNIRKDQQLFDAYGYDSYFNPFHERQTVLKERYHFECKCEACIERWPVHAHLPVYDVIHVKESQDMLRLVHINNVEKVKSLLKKILDRAEGYPYKHPSYEWFYVEHLIRESFHILGNKDSVFMNFSKNL